jgi:hypothetical protein
MNTTTNAEETDIMNATAIDDLARDASAPQGRRLALKALSAAALAAVAGVPLAADAKKDNKKKKRRNRGGIEECPPEDCTQEAEQAAAARCQSQVAPCEQFLLASCDGNAECVAGVVCCRELGDCDPTAFFACLVSGGPN